MSQLEPDFPEWINGLGPDADIVISTRARLARCLASYPFPARASREDLSMVANEIRRASMGLTGRFPGLKAIEVAKLSTEQKSYLLDAHVASIEQLKAGEGRIVILEPTAKLSIMINEEDHIRLQGMMSGLAPEEVWELVDWADDVLSASLDIGYSEKWGYLTASVTNVGTGLRVSAMMHLAGLGLKRKLNSQLRAAYDLGVSVRGLFGEGSRAVGDLFQVSNEVTLGLGETDIVRNVMSVAQYLLREERNARKELIEDEKSRLISRASQSLNSLKHGMSVSVEKSITMLSDVRLAWAMGLVEGCSGRSLNELLVGMQAGAGNDAKVCIERAALLRNKLADVHIDAE